MLEVRTVAGREIGRMTEQIWLFSSSILRKDSLPWLRLKLNDSYLQRTQYADWKSDEERVRSYAIIKLMGVGSGQGEGVLGWCLFLHAPCRCGEPVWSSKVANMCLRVEGSLSLRRIVEVEGGGRALGVRTLARSRTRSRHVFSGTWVRAELI